MAHRELIPESIHDSSQHANIRAEQSHQPTRVRELGMRRFISVRQAQRFVSVHAVVSSFFNFGRHPVRAQHYRNLRMSAFDDCSKAIA